MNRTRSVPRIGCFLLLGGAFLFLSTAPVHAQSQSGRSRVELRLGMGLRTNSGTSVGAGGVQTRTQGTGLLGAITYARWLNEDLAFTFGVGVLSVDAETSVGAGGIETRTALVIPILAGIRRYLPASSPESNVRLFGSVEAGPFVGYESAAAVGSVVATESRTQTAFGGRLGVGMDLWLSSRVTLGLLGAYDLMTDFSDPIGGQSNHSGFEFGLAAGFHFGGAAR